MSGLFIILGYSTYALVMIRANEHPPMNENNPNTFTRLESYLNREQYGDTPLLKRRYGTGAGYQEMYTKYSSDSDFFLRYQFDHMFLRYFLWQYAGIEGDWQDAGVNWKQSVRHSPSVRHSRLFRPFQKRYEDVVCRSDVLRDHGNRAGRLLQHAGTAAPRT